MRAERVFPFCPEQLGGLPTPRAAATIVGGAGADVLAGRARVVDTDGRDVTDAFLRGARETLAICRRFTVHTVWLKARSPSCGVGRTSRDGRPGDGDGVTAALLKRHGIDVREHPE